MIDLLHHRGWHYLLLGAIGGLMYFVNLGGATLWDLDEGRNMACSREMMEAGNWIVPTFNGSLRVHKPALLYWLQIFSYQTFGVNEFAGRFPSALAALLTVLLTYELTRSMFTRSTGLLAGVIVASTPMLCGAARFANPDAVLTCSTVLTLTIFWLGLSQRRWWWFLSLGIATGLGVLAKGPVGLVLPMAICLLFLLWERQLRLVWDRGWFFGFWGFVLTALPWYIWVGLETHGEFLSGFLWRHNIERGMSAMENHGGFPGYYLVVLLIGTAPWSIFLAVAGWFAFWSAIRCPTLVWQGWWARACEIGAEESDGSLTDRPAAYRLLMCWIIVYLLFFSVAATKLPNYVLPTVIPCAILIARFLQRWRTESLQVPAWIPIVGLAALLLLGISLSFGLAAAGGVGELPVMRGHFLPALQAWAFVGLIPIIAAALGFWFLRQRQFSRLVVALSVSAVLLLGPLAAFGSAVFNGFKAPRPLAEQAELLRRDKDIRIGGWQVEHLPSLNFYVQRNIEHLHDDNALTNFVGARLPVYLLMPLADWEGKQDILRGRVRVVGRHYDLYHRTEIVVLSNH